MTALLEVQDLAVHLGAAPDTSPLKPILHPLSFKLKAGEVLTLLGESGSGKSLLAQAVMGTLPPELLARGQVSVQGTTSPAGQPQQRRALWGRQLALLPQEPWSALNPTMRAGAQVAEVHQLVRGLAGAEARASARQSLATVGLARAARHYPWQLSGGMAQRVAFAATTAAGAPVLIVDEPTKGLDADLRNEIVSLLRGVLDAGGAVLLITHDVALPRMLHGQVAVLRDGQLLEHGPSAQVLEAPTQAYTRALLAAEPRHWPVLPPAQPSPATNPAGPLLHATDLSLQIGGRTLFSEISLRIQPGDRMAITGPSGSGKTSLGNVLLGLVQPTAGRVQRQRQLGPHAVQKLYQDPLAAFAPQLPLRTALADVMRLQQLHPDRLTRLLARLSLNEGLLNRRPDQVSGGELQRVALARVLLLEPRLVFADEPTSRLDPLTQQHTMALLTNTLAEYGGALLLVTHDASLARRVADRCLTLSPAAP